MKRPPAPPSPAQPTELVYGLRAVAAVLAARPTDAIELAFDPRVERDLAPALDLADALHLRIVRAHDAELRSKTRTHNHEGLALTTRPRRWTPPKELDARLTAGVGAAVALDRVRNAYNIGAILRSAAFFGLDAVLFGSRAPDPDLPEDAVRVAEGGAERLALSRTTDLADTLGRLSDAGVQIVAAESDGAESAVGFRFAARSVLVLGHEREGISDRVRAKCHSVVAIKGSGAIESLNVAIAASLMISELVRGRPSKPAVAGPAIHPANRPAEPKRDSTARGPRR